MEELLSRHRKEKRDLQSRITQKKKNATKKTRKGVNDECERLEQDLAEKQRAEIEELEPPDPSSIAQIEDGVEGLIVNDSSAREPGRNGDAASTAPESEQGGDVDLHAPDQSRSKKPNRQKARLARRAAEQEAQAAAAALEAENLPDLRDQEMSSMKQQMESRGLSETLIRPDGHCLFSACAHSMPAELLVSKSTPNKEPYQNVREVAADFMATHPDDFEAFMEEPLNSYVKKMRDTAEWGGQLELQAIARSYNININVLQADGRVERIGPDSSDHSTEAIWLAYYRHSFGLGEHYNALKQAEKP